MAASNNNEQSIFNDSKLNNIQYLYKDILLK